MAIAASEEKHTPDPGEAAIAIAPFYRDSDPLPIVFYHCHITKSDVLNMEAVAFLSRYPVQTVLSGAVGPTLPTRVPQTLNPKP